MSKLEQEQRHSVLKLPERPRAQLELKPPDPEATLEKVRAKGWGLYASAGENYGIAVFGRDSLEAAEDILSSKPEIAKDVITTLAKFQGTKTDLASEEDQGKIHHELRMLNADTPDKTRRLIQSLQRKWGTNRGTDRLLYYGSVDATELFVNLAASYCKNIVQIYWMRRSLI